MNAAVEAEELSRGEYELFRKLVYEKAGINLGDQKLQLVRARLGKHVRKHGFTSFRGYYEHVRRDADGGALCEMLDAITTNTTHLFRENRHFEWLRATVAGWVDSAEWRNRRADLRIWSAACSTGEEPYSIGITVREALSESAGLPVKILATDISTRVLDRAAEGLYDAQRLGTVPANYRQKYFERVGKGKDGTLRVSEAVRKLITFSRLNLMAPAFPFKRGFDVIFCRNVMIYFDKPTQEALVNKLAQHLLPGGFLLIGHSESLNGVRHPLSYIEPTIYQKP